MGYSCSNGFAYKPPDHQQVTITCNDKSITCDKEIVSLVRWLNEFPDTETQFSCQGDQKEYSYVMFRTSQDSLSNILKQIPRWETSHPLFEHVMLLVPDLLGNMIDYPNHPNYVKFMTKQVEEGPRYMLYMDNIEVLRKLQKFLKIDDTEL